MIIGSRESFNWYSREIKSLNNIFDFDTWSFIKLTFHIRLAPHRSDPELFFISPHIFQSLIILNVSETNCYCFVSRSWDMFWNKIFFLWGLQSHTPEENNQSLEVPTPATLVVKTVSPVDIFERVISSYCWQITVSDTGISRILSPSSNVTLLTISGLSPRALSRLVTRAGPLIWGQGAVHKLQHHLKGNFFF